MPAFSLGEQLAPRVTLSDLPSLQLQRCCSTAIVLQEMMRIQSRSSARQLAQARQLPSQPSQPQQDQGLPLTS